MDTPDEPEKKCRTPGAVGPGAGGGQDFLATGHGQWYRDGSSDRNGTTDGRRWTSFSQATTSIMRSLHGNSEVAAEAAGSDAGDRRRRLRPDQPEPEAGERASGPSPAARWKRPAPPTGTSSSRWATAPSPSMPSSTSMFSRSPASSSRRSKGSGSPPYRKIPALRAAGRRFRHSAGGPGRPAWRRPSSRLSVGRIASTLTPL